jgi:hypothetical protein
MNSLLNRSLKLITQGLLMGLGISFSMWLVFLVPGYFEEEAKLPSFKETDVSNVLVSSSRLVTFGFYPIVSFELQNETDKNIETVRVEFQLVDENGLYGKNDRGFGIGPNGKLVDIIEFKDFRSNDLPDNTTVNVIIKSVLIRDE